MSNQEPTHTHNLYPRARERIPGGAQWSQKSSLMRKNDRYGN